MKLPKKSSGSPTVRRVSPSRTPVKTKKIKKKPMNIKKFAEDLLANPDDLRDLVLSDVKTFHYRDGKIMAYPRSEEFNKKKKRNRNPPPKILVFGWIDGRGRGSIHPLEDRQAKTYQKMLDEAIPSYKELRPGSNRIVLKQGNFPAYTKAVRDWNDKHADGAICLKSHPCPVAKPWDDLNPLEEVWKQMTTNNHEDITENDDMWQCVQKAWGALSDDYCAGLANSMKERLKKVISNDGN